MLTFQPAVDDFKQVFCVFIQDQLLANFLWFFKMGAPLVKHLPKANVKSEKVGKQLIDKSSVSNTATFQTDPFTGVSLVASGKSGP